MALVISARRNETVNIGDVKIRIKGVKGSVFSVAIEAPKEMKIFRSDLVKGDDNHSGIRHKKDEVFHTPLEFGP